jgi:hypothetical protein
MTWQPLATDPWRGQLTDPPVDVTQTETSDATYLQVTAPDGTVKRYELARYIS